MISKDPRFKSCERIYTINYFSFSGNQISRYITLSVLDCKLVENIFRIFAEAKVGMTSVSYNSEHLQIETSYQICAMQKVLRIFSTNLQFGALNSRFT